MYITQPAVYNTQPVVYNTQPVVYITQPVVYITQPAVYKTREVDRPTFFAVSKRCFLSVFFSNVAAFVASLAPLRSVSILGAAIVVAPCMHLTRW